MIWMSCGEGWLDGISDDWLNGCVRVGGKKVAATVGYDGKTNEKICASEMTRELDWAATNAST